MQNKGFLYYYSKKFYFRNIGNNATLLTFFSFRTVLECFLLCKFSFLFDAMLVVIMIAFDLFPIFLLSYCLIFYFPFIFWPTHLFQWRLTKIVLYIYDFIFFSTNLVMVLHGHGFILIVIKDKFQSLNNLFHSLNNLFHK